MSLSARWSPMTPLRTDCSASPRGERASGVRCGRDGHTQQGVDAGPHQRRDAPDRAVDEAGVGRVWVPATPDRSAPACAGSSRASASTRWVIPTVASVASRASPRRSDGCSARGPVVAAAASPAPGGVREACGRARLRATGRFRRAAAGASRVKGGGHGVLARERSRQCGWERPKHDARRGAGRRDRSKARATSPWPVPWPSARARRRAPAAWPPRPTGCAPRRSPARPSGGSSPGATGSPRRARRSRSAAAGSCPRVPASDGAALAPGGTGAASGLLVSRCRSRFASRMRFGESRPSSTAMSGSMPLAWIERPAGV